MKATELMIGDWVEYRFTGWTEKGGFYKNYQDVKISTIGKLYVKADHDRVASADGEEFFPIPLTPEILEKNGWENVGDEDSKIMQIYRGNDAFFWSSNEGICGCEGIENKDGEEHIVERFACENIWNVHELQHALRLCGIEKEIIL